ncbi:MAG: SRPBCC domain-containing protein [Candidatus Kerfeldbacteria bacterium]|nr:SRPBCC domain-containing protein [Candidatus Kerfeldbacteria bacterium]
MLPGTPHQVYELLMDEKQHASFSGGEASISQKVGGAFSTFDGWASGKNVELIPDKKIVQTWRADDWPAGHYSTITIKLLKAPRAKSRTPLRSISDTDGDDEESWYSIQRGHPASSSGLTGIEVLLLSSKYSGTCSSVSTKMVKKQISDIGLSYGLDDLMLTAGIQCRNRAAEK